MHGVCSYMGWTHIPDMDTHTSSAEKNPFAAAKQQPVGKVSVTLPTDNWLCRKIDGLNLTLTQGYLSRSSEAGRLQRDQFVKHSNSQVRWYGLHPTRTDQSKAQQCIQPDSKIIQTHLTSSMLSYPVTGYTQMLGKGSQGVHLHL